MMLKINNEPIEICLDTSNAASKLPLAAIFNIPDSKIDSQSELLKNLFSENKNQAGVYEAIFKLEKPLEERLFIFLAAFLISNQTSSLLKEVSKNVN